MFARTLCIAFALLLAGCQVQFNSEIHTQDVFADESLTFPAQLKLEINSCATDKRQETDAEVLALFSEASTAKLKGCKKIGMDSMLAVDFVAEISSTQGESDLALLRKHRADASTELRIVLKPAFLRRINAFLNKNHQSLDYDDVSIRITVRNDEMTPVSVSIISGWLDGEAGQNFTKAINRRESVEILASKVVSALVLKKQKPLVAVLRKKINTQHGSNAGEEAKRRAALAEKKAAAEAKRQAALAEKKATAEAKRQAALAEKKATAEAKRQTALAEKKAAAEAKRQAALAEKKAAAEAKRQAALAEKKAAAEAKRQAALERKPILIYDLRKELSK